MKITRFLSLAAIAVATVAMVSCDSKNRHKSDDEDPEVSEIVVDDDVTWDDSDYATLDLSPAVSRFVKLGKTYVDRISDLYTMDQLNDIDLEMDRVLLEPISSNYTSFTGDDRTGIIMILAEVYGTFAEKSLDFSDEYYTDDEKYQIGYNIGQTIGKVVMESDNFAEMYTKLNDLR